MGAELRRDKRIATDLQVELSLREGVDGPVLAGPVRGFLNDVSLYGARFTVSEIHMEQYHIFYSCHDNPSLVVCLEINNPEKNGDVFSVPVRPVWFDRILRDGVNEKPFQIGGEFLAGPKNEHIIRLKKMISQKKQGDVGWLSKFLHGFTASSPNNNSDK